MFFVKYVLTTGLINLFDFNYKTYNKKFHYPYSNKELPLLLSDRLGYSIVAFMFGNISVPIKIVNYIDYKYILYLKENPNDYIGEDEKKYPNDYI